MTETKPRYSLDSERVDIHTLQPHPRNARVGDTDVIAESLRVNGQFRPIVIAQDGTILAGNHTYMAAMELGWTHMSVVRLPLHPASTEAMKVLLADNKTADHARYDDGLLAQLLRELDEEAGLIGTGYDHDDLAALLASIEDPGRGFGVNDPEPARCPNCGYTLSGE